MDLLNVSALKSTDQLQRWLPKMGIDEVHKDKAVDRETIVNKCGDMFGSLVLKIQDQHWPTPFAKSELQPCLNYRGCDCFSGRLVGLGRHLNFLQLLVVKFAIFRGGAAIPGPAGISRPLASQGHSKACASSSS